MTENTILRIDFDPEVQAIYVEVADGKHARTVEIEADRIYVDVDAEDKTLGIEFLSLDAFQQYIRENSGLVIPKQFSGPGSLVPA